MKTCSKCGATFETKSKTKIWCAKCSKVYTKAYYAKNSEKLRKLRKEYYYANHELVLEKSKAERDVLRLETFNIYGGQFCACCGEDNLKFLSLDHIAGGGTQHRKSLNGIGGVVFYKWLKRHNWPEGYQVLCYNCNCGKAHNKGICPHEEEIETI